MRENNEHIEKFLIENYVEVIKAFDFLENDENYFAKREGLKTLYEVLC